MRLEVLFGPEHGISGAAAAGEAVDSGRDPETGLPVVSLYGAGRSPEPEALAGLEVLVFDIQDIGVRFYTYISTLRNALLAASRAGDRLLGARPPEPERRGPEWRGRCWSRRSAPSWGPTGFRCSTG